MMMKLGVGPLGCLVGFACTLQLLVVSGGFSIGNCYQTPPVGESGWVCFWIWSGTFDL